MEPGRAPKTLSGIEFLQSSLNQQVLSGWSSWSCSFSFSFRFSDWGMTSFRIKKRKKKRSKKGSKCPGWTRMGFGDSGQRRRKQCFRAVLSVLSFQQHMNEGKRTLTKRDGFHRRSRRSLKKNNKKNDHAHSPVQTPPTQEPKQNHLQVSANRHHFGVLI